MPSGQNECPTCRRTVARSASRCPSCGETCFTLVSNVVRSKSCGFCNGKGYTGWFSTKDCRECINGHRYFLENLDYRDGQPLRDGDEVSVSRCLPDGTPLGVVRPGQSSSSSWQKDMELMQQWRERLRREIGAGARYVG